MNKTHRRQVAKEIIKTYGDKMEQIMAEYQEKTKNMPEGLKKAYWDTHYKEDYARLCHPYNSAMRVMFYTFDHPIEKKQKNHRPMVAKMRKLGLHRMLLIN